MFPFIIRDVSVASFPVSLLYLICFTVRLPVREKGNLWPTAASGN